MKIRIWKLPDLAQGIIGATVTSILAEEGQIVGEDDVILEMETDKSVVDIPSPFSGTLVEWCVSVGDEVKVGEPVVKFISMEGTTIGRGPARIALHNLRAVNEARKPPRGFSKYAPMFNEVERCAQGFARVDLSRLPAPAQGRLVEVLYRIWDPIVTLRKFVKNRVGGTAHRRHIQRLLDTDYPNHCEALSRLLADARKAMRASVFIGSSTHGLPVAREVQRQLAGASLDCSLWKNDPVFQLGYSTLTGLLEAVKKYDFGVFVFGPDDKIKTDNGIVLAPRDNVIFEYGLFLGRLGRDRALVIRANQSSILTDLHGIVTGNYDADNDNLHSSLGPACSQVADSIKDKWAWPI